MNYKQFIQEINQKNFEDLWIESFKMIIQPLNIRTFIKARRKFIKKKVCYASVFDKQGSFLELNEYRGTNISFEEKSDRDFKMICLALNSMSFEDAVWELAKLNFNEINRNRYSFCFIFKNGESIDILRKLYKKDSEETEKLLKNLDEPRTKEELLEETIS